MTLRFVHSTAVCGLSLLVMSHLAAAQAPRYQSPINAPAPRPLNLPVTPAITPNGEVVEDVVARINDQIISRSDVERSEQQLAQDLQQANTPAAEAADRQKNMLRDMIDQQLLLSRAKELGLNADAEVINRLNEIRKQNNLDSMEALEKAARQQGVSFEDFKANIRNGILTQEVVRDEVGRRLQLSQAQEQAFYDAHKQEFTLPEQVRLSEILVPVGTDANDAALADAQAKATALKAKLDAGAKFEDVAKASSSGPTAAQGGDLGQFKRGDQAKVLEDQEFALKTGDSTAPIRTRQGFVILKVTEHTAGGTPPLKEIEPKLQEAMYMDQMQPALRAYLTRLREEAYVDIKPGYGDSGASEKQTKPVFTAYAPPVVKKKKVTQKQRFDRGGRFSTASATPPAPVKAASPTPAVVSVASDGTANPALAATASSTLTPVSTTGGQMARITRRRRVKKEKIRFGQAPRTSLPTAPDQTGLAADDGLGANHERRTASADAAPGTAIAPLVVSTSASDVNPLTPVAPERSKTRFSARAKEEAVAKTAKKSAKVKEKAASAAAPLTADETAAASTQAAALGLSGDTVKKPKKVKVKGAPKERLQDQPAKPPAPLPAETPSKAPDRGTPLEGTAGAGRTKPKPDTIPLPGDNGPSTATPPGTTTNPTTPANPGNPIPPATPPL